MKDIVIIGGGIAGLTASIYAARAGKSVTLIESTGIGGQISTSPRVENYPGIMQISGMELADRLYEQATALGVEIELDRVTGITDGRVKTVTTEYGGFDCSAVIIATGVHHRKLGIPGEDKLAGHGVSYCAVCDGAFFRDKAVAVIGGGSTALVSADLLANGCSKVYLIHRRDEFRGEASLLAAIEKNGKIEIIRSHTPESIDGDGRVSEIAIKSVKTGETRALAVDGVFVAAGQIPSNDCFASVVKLDEGGYIVAGEDTKTGTAGIFAAGDCRTKEVRQLTTAASDGAVAAIAACDYLRTL